MKYEHDLTYLKKYTEELIKDARIERVEGDDENIDYTIVDKIEKINENPDLTTVGSCSGHDDFPWVSVVFKNDVIKKIYLKKMRDVGYTYKYASKFRLNYFIHNYNIFKTNVYEEVGFFKKTDECLTIDESGKIWNDFVRILGKR